MHKQRRWRKRSHDCGFLALNFLLALGFFGGKHMGLKGLALYKNVTYLFLIFSVSLCVHSCSVYTSNINRSFCLDNLWKTLKTPTPFSFLSPSHMCRKEKNTWKKNKGVSHPSWQQLCTLQEYTIFWKKAIVITWVVVVDTLILVGATFF